MWQKFWRRTRHHPSLVVGGLILTVLILGGLFSTQIATHPWDHQDVLLKLQKPNSTFWFGTDELGRDIFSRVLYGSRVSLTMGLFSVGFGLSGGLILGSLAGFYGGWIDSTVLFLTEILLAFPGILLALAVVTVIGPGITNAMIAVGVASIPMFTRLVRAQVMLLKEHLMVEAGRAIGLHDWQLIRRYILPNAFGPIIVQATLRVGTALLTASTLSFMGLGAEPGQPEWGAMLSNGRNQLFNAPHVALFPGLAITLAVVSINLVGDSLRDMMDPLFRKG